MEKVDLSRGRITIEARPGYLLVTEQGWLALPVDVERYAKAVDAASERARLRQLLIDTRLGAPTVRSAAVEIAFWRWVASGKRYERVAMVLGDEIAVAEVNMRALSERSAVRAFATTRDAHRWIAKGRLSRMIEAVTTAPEREPAGLRRPEPGSADRVVPTSLRAAVEPELPRAPLRSDVHLRRGAQPPEQAADQPEADAGGDDDGSRRTR